MVGWLWLQARPAGWVDQSHLRLRMPEPTSLLGFVSKEAVTTPSTKFNKWADGRKGSKWMSST